MTFTRRKFQVQPAEQGTTLQNFLRDHVSLSNRQAKQLLDRREVYVNGKRVWMARHPLRKGDVVEAPDRDTPVATRGEMSLELLYEDKWLVAVNKPPGLLSDRHPDSVESRLRKQLNLPGLRALHRLDRPTTGVLLFNRKAEEREPWLELFRQQGVGKHYRALLIGNPGKTNPVVRSRLDGKSAETRFTFLKRRGDFLLADCQITTGRTHQIRRHALRIQCRVAGDRHYGQSGPLPDWEKKLPHHLLHAHSVSFVCPQRNLPVTIQAPLPSAFEKTLRRLNLK